MLVTVTVAEADLVGSATLVTVTVSVAAVDGAVYNPARVIVPSKAFQLTAVFDVPVTVSVNCSVPPVEREMMTGLIPITTAGGATPEFKAPSSHAPELGRALPALSEFKGVIAKLVRLAPKAIAADPALGT